METLHSEGELPLNHHLAGGLARRERSPYSVLNEISAIPEDGGIYNDAFIKGVYSLYQNTAKERVIGLLREREVLTTEELYEAGSRMKLPIDKDPKNKERRLHGLAKLLVIARTVIDLEREGIIEITEGIKSCRAKTGEYVEMAMPESIRLVRN